MEKITIGKCVVVEGKYDKIKLSNIICDPIITTDGFKVFSDKEKAKLIKYYAENGGILIITDSDKAGFEIRRYVSTVAQNGEISNVYLPDVFGKEKRKKAPSKEGKIGVEGYDNDIILNALIEFKSNLKVSNEIKSCHLYEFGLMGNDNSKLKKEKLLKNLNLPQRLSNSMLLKVLNQRFSKAEFEKYLNNEKI